MTTPLITEHPRASRRGGDRTARRTSSMPTVEALRAQSNAALSHLARVLGYPPEWADELERRAFASGRVWSFTPCGDGNRTR